MSEAVDIELPGGVAGWSGPVDSNDGWMSAYHGAENYKQAYMKNGASVSLFVGYYPKQRQGEELINDLNRIIN